MAKRAAKKATRKRKGAGKKPIESYDHQDKQRANNPPVGLVTPATDPDEAGRQTYQYDPHLDPQLVWAGKAEHTSFTVPTVSLHVHERIDPRTIIEEQIQRSIWAVRNVEPVLHWYERTAVRAEIKEAAALAATLLRTSLEQRRAQLVDEQGFLFDDLEEVA